MSHDRPAPPAPVRMAGLPTISRRGFIRGASVAGLALGSPALLSACGTEAAKQTAATCVSKDLSAKQKVVDFSNWPDYIDVATKKVNGQKKTVTPTLDHFESETGIRVVYNTDVNDNVEFFGKVRNQLAACEPTGRDIFVLTDWMAGRMVGLGWLQKLDHANLPNVAANLRAELKSPPWDPHRDYSVPWQSGLTGIAYNAKYLPKGVGSMEELLTRSDLKGRISMLFEMNDTMGFMLKIIGADPAKFTDDQWGQAIDKLQGYVDSGQIRRFTGNDYIRDLQAGNVVACEAWSGDVIAEQFSNPDIKWVVPEEGLSLWSDNMLVPNKADHKTNAENLMNYYYEPEVAARLAAWVNYICPVDGAREAMTKVSPDLVDNPLIFPDTQFLSKAFAFKSTDEKTRQKYETAYAQVVGS